MNQFILFLMLILSTNAYADTKISAMTEETAPALTDYTVTVNSTPANRKVKIVNAFKSANMTVDGTNVGVGSVNPRGRIDVGPAGTYYGDGSHLTGVGGSPGGSGAEIQYRGGASTLSAVTGSAADANGNIGIGSTAPGQKLDVGGTVRATTFSGSAASLTAIPAAQISGVIPIANLATGTPDGTKFVRDDGTLVTPSGSGSGTVNAGNTGQMAYYAGTGTAVSTLSKLTTDNTNIGISTVTPLANLAVVGNMSVSTTWNNSLIQPPAGALIVQGNVGISTYGTSNYLNVGPSANGTVGIAVNGGRALFGYNGTTTNANITTTATKGFEIYTNGTQGSMATGGAVVTITSVGNVGLSTITPLSRLAVVGNVGIGTFGSAYITGSAPTNGLIVQGNVGIGSAVPGAALDVFGGSIRAVGIGTTVPQQLCRKVDGTFGYFDGAFTGACN